MELSIYDAAVCTSGLNVLLHARVEQTYSNVAFVNLYDGTTPLGQLDDES